MHAIEDDAKALVVTHRHLVLGGCIRMDNLFLQGQSVGLGPINATRWVGVLQAVSRCRPVTKDNLAPIAERLRRMCAHCHIHDTQNRVERPRVPISPIHSLKWGLDRSYMHSRRINLIARSEGSDQKNQSTFWALITTPLLKVLVLTTMRRASLLYWKLRDGSKKRRIKARSYWRFGTRKKKGS